MVRYVIKRLLLMIPVLLGVCILIFSIMSFVPGDPAQLILGAEANEESIQYLRELLGLNRPFLVRLLEYMKNVFLHLDFGNSYKSNISITSELAQRLPITLKLGLISTVLAVLIGVPLGIVSAVKQNGWADRISMFIALLGVSVPAFWLALLMVVLFSVRLGWLPSIGVTTWQGYIIPGFAGSLTSLATLARQSRSSMLEVIRSDYIVTARAKGMSEMNVIFKHALPNALMPIVTVVGSRLATILGGSVILENVFSIPGVGSYMVNAINGRDYPIVEGCVLILALIFSMVMLLVDLIYAFIDPKIKAQYVSGKR